MFNYFGLAVAAWCVLAPLATWGLTDLKAKWITIPNERAEAAREATDKEHKRGEDACNARVEGIRQKLASASEEARKLAAEAEESMQGTPEDKAARQAMCDADSMCRNRKQKGE